ncbi:MAG: glycerophosphodiester phosphodiesterase [Nanoarchaeota archaeon]|nr:glycerophosphodiester phosphodiesterase [Nanoarchaeota archaeon]
MILGKISAVLILFTLAIFFYFSLIQSGEITGKMIVAHRGATDFEKENTIKAFEKAIKLEAEMVEFDVRKTKDNILIIMHNEEIDGFKINQLNYKEVEEKTNFHVPKFDEALKLLAGKTKINIELKEVGYETEVLEKTLKYFSEDEIIISSKYVSCLIRTKENYNIKTCLILGLNKFEKMSLFIGIFPKEKVKNSGADFLAINQLFANSNFLKNANTYNKQVFVWDVKTRESMNRFLKEKNIAGIITKNSVFF